MVDLINNPPHYTQSQIQPLFIYEDWKLDFCLGNALKYIARYQYKGTPTQDLQKACFYIERYLRNLQLYSTSYDNFCFFVDRQLRKFSTTIYTASQVIDSWNTLPVAFHYFIHTLYDISKGKLSKQDQKAHLTSALTQIKCFMRSVFDA